MRIQGGLRLLVVLGLLWSSFGQAGEAGTGCKDNAGRVPAAAIQPRGATSAEAPPLVNPSPDLRVHMDQGGSAAHPVLYLINEFQGPAQAMITLTFRKNIRTDPRLPLDLVMPAAGRMRAFGVHPRQKDRPWAFRYHYHALPGDPKAVHAPPRPYAPPFAQGCGFQISQAFGGDFSHNRPASRYAVDFNMPRGTPVCAARDGIVMDLAMEATTGGLDQARYADKANFIRILHKDGTMAVYAHLRPGSARVFRGKIVRRGEVIAQSGNTGYSSAPHLHFVIQKNADLQIVSLPFVFDGPGGREITPAVNLRLVHEPDKPVAALDF